MRVPQVGAEDVRAYMYSLFVGMYAADKLSTIQPHLLAALQNSWQGQTFTRDEIDGLAGKPAGLLEALSVCDRLAPILATAPTISGNPRIVKRLLNAITLRRTLANTRKMNVDLATLAKLAVFERSTDGMASQRLYRLVMEATDAEKHLVPNAKLSGTRPELPAEWKKFESFVEQWREMEPYFENVAALRPAAFLSRDVMVPAVPAAGLSKAAQDAVAALVEVNSVSSPAAKSISVGLNPADQKAVMTKLIEHLREVDWTQKPKGLHGAIVLAQTNPECGADLRAFVATLQTTTIARGTKTILTTTGFLK